MLVNERQADPQPYGPLGLLVSLPVIALLSAVYGALAIGAAALADWALNGRPHLDGLIATVRTTLLTRHRSELDVVDLIAASTLYLAVIAAVLTIARRRGGRTWRALLAWRHFHIDGAFWLFVLAGGLYGLFASALVSRLYPEARDWVPLPTGPTAVALSCVLVALLAPLAEEMLFRGWAYTSLRGYFAWLPSLILVALLFALAHWESTHVYTLAVLPIGLLLGWLRERYDSLYASLLFHALYNGSTWAIALMATRA